MSKQNATPKAEFTLDDLVPQKTPFQLSTLETPLTLRPWSVLARKWALQRFGGPQAINVMFQLQQIELICELAHHMLIPEDKAKFPTADDFLEVVQTMKDQLAVQTALCGCIGIGEVEMQEIKKVLEKEPKKTEAEDPKPTRP